MGLTVGEIISNHLRFYLNIGSNAVATDQNLRDRARFFLTVIAKIVWDEAPHQLRLATGGEVTLSSGELEAEMPSDFSHPAQMMQIYIQNNPYWALKPIQPDQMASYRRTVGSNNVQGQPAVYTLQGQTSTGGQMLQVWPRANQDYTLIVDDYVRTMPDLVDRPTPCGAAVGSATGLTGVYTWVVTFVTDEGETEPGAASPSVTLANQKGSLSSIPTSPCHSVTARKVYRTAAGGSTYGLVATISDNTTTTLTDAVADGSRGAAPPTVLTAVTGIQVFPQDVQERLFVQGLRLAMGSVQGDLRSKSWEEDWRKDVKRFWGEYKQGDNAPRAFPRFGTIGSPPSGYWPRYS